MIDEIRLGNLVNAYKTPSLVLGINADHIQYDSLDGVECANCCGIHDVTGIKVNEKNLSYFGIEVYDVMGDNVFLAFKDIEPFDFNFFLRDGVLKVSFFNLTWDKSIEINYLHQLQNLYKSITHKELNKN